MKMLRSVHLELTIGTVAFEVIVIIFEKTGSR